MIWCGRYLMKLLTGRHKRGRGALLGILGKQRSLHLLQGAIWRDEVQ